ncbi:MAG: preprotein translocase subunit SecE [Planctomycetota bacterium]|jgi:preprotein translocase SecE subunit
MGLSIYKRGQGKHTRLCSALGVGIIVVLGCLQLYRKLTATELNLWVVTMVPACLFLALAILVYWFLNKPSIVDFMISSEGEMKKVSWSSKSEIATSTFIVILVVVFMAVLFWFVDLVFQMFFMWLFGY